MEIIFVESGHTLRLKWLNMTGGHRGSISVDNVNARLNISHCVFYNNGNGGAVALTNGATFEGQWNTFVGNRAMYAGAIFLSRGAVFEGQWNTFMEIERTWWCNLSYERRYIGR